MLKRLVAAAAVVVLVAACSDSGSDSEIASLDYSAVAEESASAVDEVDAEQAMLDFAECMREQGIDMGDPVVDENGNLRLQVQPDSFEDGTFDRDAMMAASEACGSYLEGMTQEFQVRDMTGMQDMLIEYAECMRENGYDMADPDLSGFGGPGVGGGEPGEEGFGGGPFAGMDPDDPAFQRANEACQGIFTDLMGEFGPGGGPAPGGFPGPGGGGE